MKSILALLACAASLAGLCRYLQGPTRQHITAELGGAVPEDVTFIFGHTHKPFEDRLPVAGFARPVAIYNIGGWILDTPMFGTVEGASALFIDDALNVASLRLFTAPAEDGPAPKRNVPPLVRVATADGDATNPMAKALAAVIAVPAVAAAWVAFAVEADAAYRETQAMILEILGRSDRDARARGKLL